MGEIGIPRREFLYEIVFWEVQRIIRGYRRRDHLTHQLLAESAFASMFSLKGSEGKTVRDIFPGIFEEEDDEPDGPDLTEEEVQDLQQSMKDWSWQTKVAK